MTTRSQLRKAALALPETEEGTRSGTPYFSVRGDEFAALSEDGRVRLRLPPERAEAVLTGHPSAEPLVEEGRPIGLLIPLADVNGMVLNALVRASWRLSAPAALVAAADRAEAADPREGDLPPRIGRPATRALYGAGLTTLDLVATRSEAELLELHGVGPSAVRTLEEALAERGKRLRPHGRREP